MKRIVLLVLLFAALFVIPSSVFTLNETEQAVITQFGEPVGDSIKEPGMHFKVPFVQIVHKFDKRWLPWDGDANQITTKDKKFIWVDTYARWRIVDPLLFFQSVRDQRQAQSRLDDIIDGETRNAVASFDLIEIVRSSNREFQVSDELQELIEQRTATQITSGREKITDMILQKASAVTPNFGIELVDVQIKRINYTDEVQASVYERMISERKRIAERSRSEGQGRSAEIRGQRERELNEIESGAFKQAQEIQGKADGQATAIYAKAYSKDPDFYQFLKTLETYRSSLGPDVTLLLGSDSEFLSFLKSSR
jgi:modulator of FtsH protease HflC